MAAIRLPLILLACLFLPLAGCAHFDMRKGIPWIKGEDGELERPMKIVAVWTDTIMSHGEQVPVRGFGGRLMFYPREDGKPVKVEGALVVYAFDETNRDPRNVRPERKYVFSEEEFVKHYSDGKLGASYSVWLPWDKVGGQQAEISLVARFTPKGGGMIVGEQQTVLLPGIVAQNFPPTHPSSPGFQNQPPANISPIQQTSYATGLAEIPGQGPAQGEKKSMTTVTIAVPPRAGNRLPVAPAPGMPIGHGQINSPQNQLGVQQMLPPGQPPQGHQLAGQQQPWQTGQPSARFGPDRRRPLGEPIAPLSRDHGPWRLTRAAQPSGPAASHQSAPPR